MDAVHVLAHFDIAGPRLDDLTDFYHGLFGWTITPRGPGYAAVTTPEGSPDGALVESEHASLTISVVVPDVSAALDLATSHGGSVVMPVTDNGWVVKARVADPAGNLVTLIQG